ncbi:MAG: HNH endonuclease [Verrucomicrobiae bacterium]|nr:HNH endonuclease [Verrucomicrobiae bacterium]
MEKDQAYWLHKLATLKIDRARGDPAPHKPFLLLMVLEMADRGEIKSQELSLSPDLAYRFSLFNQVIADRKRRPLELRLPFHHLKTSGIWQPLMADGKPSPHPRLTVKVRFDPDFFQCLKDPLFREKAKHVLIDTPPYFREPERVALRAMFNLENAGGSNANQVGPLFTAQVERGRDARFRIEVVIIAYQHTCALTGYRMTTLGVDKMESIVDAAHIHEFRDSRNNDPRNGLALCKNAHWQFDRGLWSITDDFHIIVNRKKFTENGLPGQRLADFEGRRLILPKDPKYWPNPEYLAWHREKRFSV